MALICRHPVAEVVGYYADIVRYLIIAFSVSCTGVAGVSLPPFCVDTNFNLCRLGWIHFERKNESRDVEFRIFSALLLWPHATPSGVVYWTPVEGSCGVADRLDAAFDVWGRKSQIKRGKLKERQQSFPLSARRRPSRVRARAQIAVDFTDLHISSSNKILKVSRHFAPSTTCSGRSGVLTIFAVRCR